MDLEKILEDLKVTIIKAGDEILKYYDHDFENEKKSDSPVTVADLASEKIILESFNKYEGFGVLSEEKKEDKSHIGKEWVFVVDPMDGTKDFVHKTDDFSILIALLHNDAPILGLIHKPITKKLHYAIKGQGAFVESEGEIKKIEVSKEIDFSKMYILMSQYHRGELENRLAEKLGLKYKHTGSAGLKLAALAEGVAEIYINSSSGTAEWDTAAGQIILEEAGGKITDKFGNDLEYNKENPYNLNGFIATNNTNHDLLIETIKEFL